MDSVIFHRLISRVTRPSQYLGGELNAIKKDWDQTPIRIALIFPDKYELGMSHVGLKILYDILNKIPDVVCERAFAPDLDMEEALRKENFPYFSLESHRPLSDFDVVGFSFTYELTYTNFLNILDLAHIPLRQKERTENMPLILGGGGCITNAEPLAPFLDCALIGDGEEAVLDLVNRIREKKLNQSQQSKQSRPSRQDFLESLSDLDGIYIPSLFEPQYKEDGTLLQMIPLKKGYEKVNKRILQNLDQAPYPTSLVVPSVKLIHDRIGIEIQRGCNRACRFCQAGYIDRPVRQRSPQNVLDIAEESLQKTGIGEISLLSLSAADYGCLVDTLRVLNNRYSENRVAISVPATRTEKLSPELVEQIKRVRKTGFTIAPEAGSERMRRVINKGNKVDDLFQAVRNAFSQGWELLKLYYMVGLPFETDADVLGIADEANAAISICKEYTGNCDLNLSISSFVPKPHTPFQWEPQMSLEETHRKFNLIKYQLKDRRIRFKHHHPEMSYIEGLFSRGDRHVADLVEIAFQLGARFDEWEEHFNFPLWQKAISNWGKDPAFYLHRRRTKDEILPWDHLLAQMNKDFLWNELEKAHDAAFATTWITPEQPNKKNVEVGFTEDCSIKRCSNCGICDYRKIKNRIFVMGTEEIMAKKGHREAYGWVASEASPLYSNAVIDKTSKFAYRFLYSKRGLARYMGHLEVMGIIKRALTRAKIPLCYSQGFHPQIKLAMSHPLSVGIESDWEFFDIETYEEINDNKIKELSSMPQGLKILECIAIDRKTPSLYSQVEEVTYQVKSKNWDGIPKFGEALEEFNQKTEFWWNKENKKGVKRLDLKKLVRVDTTNWPETLVMVTRVFPEGTVGPMDVYAALTGSTQRDWPEIEFLKTGVRWKNSGMSLESTSS